MSALPDFTENKRIDASRRVRMRIDLQLVVVILVFLASRIAAFVAGVNLDVVRNYQWQLIDPVLLESRWFESLVNLHSQPPLFNALHALVLELAATEAQQALAWVAIHLLAGLCIIVSLYGALRLVSISRTSAAVLTTLFVCSPAAIAYENSLSYTYIDTALLSGAIYLLLRVATRQSRPSVWLFFLVCAALCLTRAAYHIVWLAAVSVVMLWNARRNSALARTVFSAACVAVALVGGLYLKNYLMFGVAGPSSWAGMNFATMTHTNLPDGAREHLVGSGQASIFTEEIPFVGLDIYPPGSVAYVPTGIPVLDNELRSDGTANFNHAAYIEISRRFGMDAFVVLRNYPEVYAAAAARNVAVFLFRNPTDYRLIAENANRIALWDAVYSTVVYGQFGAIGKLVGESESNTAGTSLKNLPLREVVAAKAGEACLFVAFAALVLPIFAASRITVRQPDFGWENALASFAFVTMGYVYLTTNLLNFGESHRMRFEIEPLFWVMGAWLGSYLWARRKRGKAVV